MTVEDISDVNAARMTKRGMCRLAIGDRSFFLLLHCQKEEAKSGESYFLRLAIHLAIITHALHILDSFSLNCITFF